MAEPVVGVIMGSRSDWETMQHAADTLDALGVAHASIALGAGRERKGDPIDLAVGVVLNAKLGDAVSRGQPVAVLHANDEARLVDAERVLRGAIAFSSAAVEPPPVILERLATGSSASPSARA